MPDADKPRLIEVAFPLKQASLDSVHEKNVRHGHISTLHIWPARRPLVAWKGGETTALSVATARSHKFGKVLPWTIQDVIAGSMQARFTQLLDGSGKWPCEFHAAQSIRLKVASELPGGG